MTQEVEHLTSKYEALSSNPRTTKKKKKKPLLNEKKSTLNSNQRQQNILEMLYTTGTFFIDRSF
jgi:site-specific recombinase XerD